MASGIVDNRPLTSNHIQNQHYGQEWSDSQEAGVREKQQQTRRSEELNNNKHSTNSRSSQGSLEDEVFEASDSSQFKNETSAQNKNTHANDIIHSKDTHEKNKRLENNDEQQELHSDDEPESVNELEEKYSPRKNDVVDNNGYLDTGQQSNNEENKQSQEMSDEEREEVRKLSREDEPPPEYNVTERVKQLNEELKNDPVPEEDDRERTIKFRDNNLVEVAPATDEYSEEEGTPRGGGDSRRTHADYQDSNEKVQRNGAGDGDIPEEKVLVEKDGKFYYVNASDVEAVESGELDPEVAESKVSQSAKEKEYNPKPPNYPRPKTANEGQPSRRNQTDKRVKSADHERRSSSDTHRSRNETYEGFNSGNFDYQSPYGLSPNDKKRSMKMKEERQKQQKEEERKKKENEEREKEENDGAFHAWLKKKQDEAAKRRQQEQEAKKNEKEEEPRDPDGAFKEWCKVKKTQKQKQQEKEEQKKKEEEEVNDRKSSKENKKAFREWLKKKNEENKRVKKEHKEQERLRRLLSRKSRKSQQLALAIKQAQAFRYVDYYGYRS